MGHKHHVCHWVSKHQAMPVSTADGLCQEALGILTEEHARSAMLKLQSIPEELAETRSCCMEALHGTNKEIHVFGISDTSYLTSRL